MIITKQELDKTFEKYKDKYDGRKEDYFAVLYLSQEFGKKIEEIADVHVAFGGNDYGIDAFYIDKDRRNLYLFQFKWSENHMLFKESFSRLISAGMERIFGNPLQDPEQNQLLLQLKSQLNENQAIIDRVFIYFVFNGDSNKAEKSYLLDSLREDLENKKFLIDKFFGNRDVSLTFQFVSNQTKKIAGVTHTKKTHRYDVTFEQNGSITNANGEIMYVGFISLMDLYRIYKEMGYRFLERNIRAGLSADKPPNRAIRKALSDILKGEDVPSVFAFNHNGVSIFAEHIDFKDGKINITEPRILNGAQTVTSLARFVEDNKDNPALESNKQSLESIRVLSKIIYNCTRDFVINVTICNNKQNPVEPWHLRANDPIQLEFQEKFENDSSAYYERQEGSFESFTDDALEDMQIEEHRPIQIKRLAQTFLALQGEVDKMSRMYDVFENEKTYKNTFKESYLKMDSRRILLYYKIQFRLHRILSEIEERGKNKYEYVWRTRNLIWSLLIQGILNDKNLPTLCERYGTRLILEKEFNEYLKSMASKKIRMILSDAIKDNAFQEKIANEKYSFLRTKAFYLHCMDIARKKYHWKIF